MLCERRESPFLYIVFIPPPTRARANERESNGYDVGTIRMRNGRNGWGGLVVYIQETAGRFGSVHTERLKRLKRLKRLVMIDMP